MVETPTGSVPVPDPTALTNERLAVGLSNLRELIEARLDGMDAATRLLASHVERVPSEADKQANHLSDLFSERMSGLKNEMLSIARGIQLQFDERDIRSRAAEDAAKVAVNAALQAQKEAAAAQNESNAAAITKSEGATVKQIDGILALLGSNTQAINDKISAITSRLDRGEAVITAAQINRSDRNANIGSSAAIIGAIGVAGGLVLGVLGFAAIHPTPTMAPGVAARQIAGPAP